MQIDTAAPAIVPKAAYAAMRGCTPPYISKLIKLGKLRAPALTPFGQIDVAAANAMLGAPAPQLQPIAAVAPKAEDDVEADGYAAHRARREAANAEKAELELAELRNRLVDKAEVDREIAELVGVLRDAMLMIPREVAGQCASLSDERAIEAVIMLAIKRGLTNQALRAETEGRARAA